MPLFIWNDFAGGVGGGGFGYICAQFGFGRALSVRVTTLFPPPGGRTAVRSARLP